MNNLLFYLILVTGALQASNQNAAAGNAAAAQAPTDVKYAADVKGAAADLKGAAAAQAGVLVSPAVTHQGVPQYQASVKDLLIGRIINEWVPYFRNLEWEFPDDAKYYAEMNRPPGSVTYYRPPPTDNDPLKLAEEPIKAFLKLEDYEQLLCLYELSKLNVNILYYALSFVYRNQWEERCKQQSWYNKAVDYLSPAKLAGSTKYTGPKTKKD